MRELTFNGETLTLREWAERTGIRAALLRKRIVTDRWDVERALTAPRRNYPMSCKRIRDAVVDLDTPYEQDPIAQAIVRRWPDGLPLEAVGALVGWSRERVRQIEESALRKLREARYGRD